MIRRFGENVSISRDELRLLVSQTLEVRLESLRRVLILPPNHTRLNSQAGPITAMAYGMLTGNVKGLLEHAARWRRDFLYQQSRARTLGI